MDRTIKVHEFFSDYILCLIFARLYFVVRAFFNYSVYSDAYSRNICRNHDFYPGFRFILKSSLVNDPEWTAGMMLFV